MITTTGILLKSIKHLGQKKILKVFTKDHGLLSFFSSSTKLAPFSLAEWTFRETEKELISLKEGTLLDPLLDLKESYETLSFAGTMAKDLLTTQMPHKKSEDLFQLTYLYLKKLPLNPEGFLASFKLKLLLHEGLLPHTIPARFTPEEWTQIELLGFSRSFKTIEKARGVPLAKIQSFFDESLL